MELLKAPLLAPGAVSVIAPFEHQFRPQSAKDDIVSMVTTQHDAPLHRVEYFGQKLEGFAFTVAGWVQSYGSRYVRPPIVHADVARRGAMTVKEFQYAQLLTEKPVKGMLTGALAKRCIA